MSNLTSNPYEDFVSAYPDILQQVMLYGDQIAPRGMRTREVLGASFGLSNPARSLITRRGFSPAFAAAEAIQLIGGFSDVAMLERINPTMTQFFSERDGRTYQHGAYGPRARAALDAVVNTLRRDPYSRQAVMTIFDSGLDLVVTPDVPCTLSLQFTMRAKKLNLHATMRSNDVWWGLPYDVFQFTQLQMTVANLLGCDAGLYFHTAHSLHAYERDWNDIRDARVNAADFQPQGLGDSEQTVTAMRAYAQSLIGPTIRLSDTNTALWYFDKLKYVSPRFEG